ncbi:rhodanese-like domain-containing protein [Paramagnetospirillum magneticum]|uniref:Rhodanese-related sulfurtransferase n=1 Tax=Paramagnetospirillum magneticum (strain ATCC 700264 / AMB-1) TaxID=342108 RepID=Q2W563_PARM1|nr:rhodanese-like domain-containing protein [Paramagnetospirillum magneticum]BAE51012.1 Rhodanese-related sulfurtransferase [Paramagnetospirillum magneticum AMB-1]
MSNPSPLPYAGEISPAEAWNRLASEPSAKVIDVRTQAEWSFVGVPDLSPLGKQVLLVSWQVFPTMARNDAFVAQVEAHGVKKDDTLLLLCRSGVRSRAAAELLTALGYTAAWNVTDGFEGPHDSAKHRGAVAGWKASALPWAQG